MAWRAVWDNISQSAQVTCCAAVLADYPYILLLLLVVVDCLRNVSYSWHTKCYAVTKVIDAVTMASDVVTSASDALSRYLNKC